MVNYNGLTKAQVLMALYNNSRPLGMGFLVADPSDMTEEQAEKMIQDCKDDLYFDYVKGRVMKIDLRSDNECFDEYLYDRDNGTGAAQSAINRLRAEKGSSYRG